MSPVTHGACQRATWSVTVGAVIYAVISEVWEVSFRPSAARVGEWRGGDGSGGASGGAAWVVKGCPVHSLCAPSCKPVASLTLDE